MKRLFLAVLLVVVLAATAYAANRNFGYKAYASGTTDPTISWTGPSASNISIFTETADITLDIKGYNATDTTITVAAGTTITLDGLTFYGFTITRTTATAVEVLWW